MLLRMIGVTYMRIFQTILALGFLTISPWESYLQTKNCENIVSSAGSNNSIAFWMSTRTDTTHDQLQNLVVKGEPVTEIDPTQPRIVRKRKFVFIGTAHDMTKFSSNAGRLIQSDIVGLYGHWNGISHLTPNQITTLSTYWASTSPGFKTGGQGQMMAELGACSNVNTRGTCVFDPIFNPLSYHILRKFGGKIPREININLYNAGAGRGKYVSGNSELKPNAIYSCYMTSSDLRAAKKMIDVDIAGGAYNVAIVSSPNCGTEDLDDPFATAPFWANVRAAALYGGALALDTAPAHVFSRGQAFLSITEQQIQWAIKNHIRVTTIIEPSPRHNSDGRYTWDNNYLNNTKKFIEKLIRDNSLPTSYSVENFSKATDVTGDNVPNSLNQVAQYLVNTIPSSAGTAAPQAPGGRSEATAMLNRP